jgi:outer membrane receptor protein involved in Fe transport
MTRRALPILVVLALALPASLARAQSQSGAITGTVSSETGAPLELVTVAVSGPSLQQAQTEFTDASGQYSIAGLPPGTYSVLFFYDKAQVRRENVVVSVGKVTVVTGKIDTSTPGEVIVIKERPPAIDGGSTKLGLTVTQETMKNLPYQGRSFAGLLDSTAGSQGDLYGEGFSGSSSVENSYVVDGINTTGLTFGGITAPVINNFIQEVEVITGGYNAEYGRSTGGVVNVVTKTGSNEFHGSVWGNVTPFEARRQGLSTAGSAISRQDALDRNFDLGFDLGGPLVKDKLWFYVGFAPLVDRTKVTRITGTNVDRNVRGFDYGKAGCKKNFDGTCDGDNNPATTPAPGCELKGICEGDGHADLDPATGFPIVEEVDRQSYLQSLSQYQFTGKLNFAVSPDHQGQLSLTGVPSQARNVLSVAGTPTANQDQVTDLTTDAVFKWTSKLFDGKTQLDAVVGWHRQKHDARSINDTLPGDPLVRTDRTPEKQIFLSDPKLTNLGVLGQNRDTMESATTLAFCSDGGPRDQFPKIANCPVTQYNYDSLGSVSDREENRATGKLTVTQRLKALGHHQLKAGLDFEQNSLFDRRNYTGGALLQSFGDWEFSRFVRVGSGDEVCGFDSAGKPRPCTYLGELPVHGGTFNWAGFVQDSWSILPNLTINLGVRYEQQHLGYSDEVKDIVDPITMKTVGDEALALDNLIAPRVGFIYDWTQEGKSKLYASWGRFFESVPMDINERSFGGESQYYSFWDWRTQCGKPSSDPRDPALPSLPSGCPLSASADGKVAPKVGDALIGGNDPKFGVPAGLTLTQPGLKPQYLDELVVGAEYEILPDLRAGLSFQHRSLGRVIEDISTDGGNTFFIGNPGEFDDGEERSLVAQIKGMSDGPVRQALENRLAIYRGARQFDAPRRVYNAIQLTASKRFSRNFFVQGSYTLSRLEGNYPGLFSPDTGQLDPNISSQYDLYELLANHDGLLPSDRTHNFKLDGYYTFDLGDVGRLTAGARLRGQSGTPISVLGRHISYGTLESYVLPRSAAGRTGFETNADLHLAYARKLGPTELELFVELFNVLNTQEEAAVDSEYTQDAVDPIVGGGLDDLPYLKKVGQGAALARKKINFGNTTARVAPLQGRIGATLSF